MSLQSAGPDTNDDMMQEQCFGKLFDARAQDASVTLCKSRVTSLLLKSPASSLREGDEMSGCPRNEPGSREGARALEGL